MAHHRRHRPKHQRAGCLLCKPWKDERGGKNLFAAGVARSMQAADYGSVDVIEEAAWCPGALRVPMFACKHEENWWQPDCLDCGGSIAPGFPTSQLTWHLPWLEQSP